MDNLFNVYQEIKLKGEIGILRRNNIQNNSKKTYHIRGKLKYGKLVEDEFFNKSDELLYRVEYFISYDSNYRYIRIKDEKNSACYETEDLPYLNISEGNIVTLKTGGPKMEIIGFNKDYVKCQWNDQSGVKSVYYPYYSLENVSK
ncbi:DUF2158 domain-containing protein [Aquimarina spongiae]|uniref:Uncharacterized small protein n=1 Tax=Aquimarina spongiae TaxID=570521 RepID=A0A1M6LMR4_9FLAO|nr:DUF2158 domain-containing protein [Aquimarina spongiae]SHJ72531.1 Uncharacterized small protein [Aquimarina spongiae]